MEASVLCIGAAHVDRKARSAGPVVLGSSNPVSTRASAGGVARNVAENLARLGLRVSMLSVVGDDAEGEGVLAGLASAGVDVSLVARHPTLPTASYTALLDPAGELVVALADMAVYDALDPALVEGHGPAMAPFAAWFVDCNLPAATLRHLLRARPPGVLMFVDTVSVAKAARLDASLQGIDTLFANRDEAACLARISIRAPLDVCEAGHRLLSRGAANVVISRGPDGAFIATPDEWHFLPAVPAQVMDVTGAGDAMMAGTICGRLHALDAPDALRLGLACAALAVETPDTVYGGLTAPAALQRAGLAHLAA